MAVAMSALPTTPARRRRPIDVISTDGHLLTRGAFEVELADEGAGRFGIYFDPTDPKDEHYLTLNIYAVSPDHPNGCGRILLNNATIVTMTPVNTADAIIKRLITEVADRLESAGLDPYLDLAAENPDVSAVMVDFAGLAPTLY